MILMAGSCWGITALGRKCLAPLAANVQSVLTDSHENIFEKKRHYIFLKTNLSDTY